MPYWIITIELALLVILPLIIYYKKVKSSFKVKITSVFSLYVIWFLSYAFIHELSHLIGSLIMGTQVLGFQLIPQFWKGDFKTAFVNSQFENSSQAIVSLIMPYLRDILFLLIGFSILKRIAYKSLFLNGLILILFILSPLFDIINNYSGYLISSFGDFMELSKVVGVLFTNLFGVTLFVIAAYIFLKFYLYFKNNNLKPEL